MWTSGGRYFAGGISDKSPAADGVVSVTRIAGAVFTVAVGVKLGLLAAATLDSIIIPKA